MLFRRVSRALLTLALCCGTALAGTSAVFYKVGDYYLRWYVADTHADLPTSGPPEGALAYVKDSDAVECFDGAAWVTTCFPGGGSGAPTGAEYVVGALHASLSAERVGTDTAEVDWDFGTAGQAKLNLIDDSIEASRLKTSDTPADGECVVYESTGDEVAFEACASAPQLNQVTNPTSNKTFSMTSNLLQFTYTNPVPSGSYEGAFEVEATGNFGSGAGDQDLVHIHQHTGDPGTMFGLHLSTDDADAFPLKVAGAHSTGLSVQTNDGIQSDARFQLVSTTTASATCIAATSDRLYADKDCDETKDAGEEYLDEAAGGTSVTLDLQADGGTDSSAITQIEARNNYEGWFLKEPTADVATFDANAATDQALSYKSTTDTPDDEFNSGTLDAKWTIRAGYSGCASGTVSLLETGDVEEYDLTSQPGWLLVATGSTTSYSCGFMQTYTIPDGNSVILKAAMSQIPPTNNGHQYGMNLCDDSSCTNYIQLFIDQDLNAQRVLFQETGTATGTGGNVYVDAAFFYLRLARDGLNYYGFVSTNGVTWTNLGWFTTGAAWGYIEIMSGVSGAHSSTATVPISAFDWFRLGTNNLNPW